MNPFKKRLCSALLLSTAVLLPQLSSADSTNDFAYTSSDVEQNLVILKCTGGASEYTGCGFIARMEGKLYLFTNQHIILGAEKISFVSPTKRAIRPKKIELSNQRDIARLALSEGDALDLSGTTSMGDQIGVFSSTLDQLQLSFFGSVTGLGADIVEVSADFTETHSGSPVLNEAKEVVGIASHVKESSGHAMKKGTKFENKTRHFCYRLTGNEWKAVNWKAFNQKYGTIHRDATTFTDGIIEILNSWADDPFEKIHFEDPTERALTSWADTHNEVIGAKANNTSFNRKYYAAYSDSTRKLADVCRNRARRIRMVAEQRGVTEFLKNEYDMQAGTLEYAAKIIDRYTTTTDY